MALRAAAGVRVLSRSMREVFGRPGWIALEVAWRWSFGIPFLLVCQDQWMRMLDAVSPNLEAAGPFDWAEPLQSVLAIAAAWDVYATYVWTILIWFLPAVLLCWTLAAGVGRGLLLTLIAPELESRLAASTVAQIPATLLRGLLLLGWYGIARWTMMRLLVATIDPDPVFFGFSLLLISAPFYLLWVGVSWPFELAPVWMLLEKSSPIAALQGSLRVGRGLRNNLIVVHLTTGILKFLLYAAALFLSLVPLYCRRWLGETVLDAILGAIALCALVSCDILHVVRQSCTIQLYEAYRDVFPGILPPEAEAPERSVSSKR